MSRELKRRIAKLEAAAVVEAQRRGNASLRGLTLEQLDDMIIEIFEHMAAKYPSHPPVAEVIAEVRGTLAAGDRRRAARIIGRVRWRCSRSEIGSRPRPSRSSHDALHASTL